MNRNITRRHFIKTTVTGAGMAYLAPTLLSNTSKAWAAESKSRVVMASHPLIVDESEQINEKIVRVTIDETLIALTNTASVQDAWMDLFPRLQSTDVIGIKVNCSNWHLPSHPQVVYALAQSMTESLAMNPNNIIIWDRMGAELMEANYTRNLSAKGIRCLGTVAKSDYDQSFAVDMGDGAQVHLSKILTEMCTYLINVPVLKDHIIAGVTLSLKNHYGSIDRPSLGHAWGCNPYIAHLNNTPHIKDKTQLILCDALFGIYKGGPSGRPQWINRQLLASTDPVALDYTGMTLIDQQRQEKELPLVSKGTRHIQTAAALGIGTNDPQKMEILNVEL